MDDPGLGVTDFETPPMVILNALKSLELGLVPKLTPESNAAVLEEPVETPGFELLRVKLI